MTVGLSEQAKMLVDPPDLNVLRMVGCVPSVTFFRSDKTPVATSSRK